MSALGLDDAQAQLVTSVVRTLTDADDGSRQLLRLVVEHDASTARRLSEATALLAELVREANQRPSGGLPGNLVDRLETWLDKERK